MTKSIVESNLSSKYRYYYAIKMAAARTAIKSMVLPDNKNDNDVVLELAVRRRRTKSLLREDELRKIMSNLYEDKFELMKKKSSHHHCAKWTSDNRSASEIDLFENFPASSAKVGLDAYTNEDCLNVEVVTPRDTDRILEQFVTMLLKIGIYLRNGFSSENIQQLHMHDNAQQKEKSHTSYKIGNVSSHADILQAVGSSKGTVASYVRDYPQIFRKESSENKLSTDNLKSILDNIHRRHSNKSVVRIKSYSFDKTVNYKEEDDTTECTSKHNTKDIANGEKQVPNANNKNDIRYRNKKLTINDDSSDVKWIKSTDSLIVRVDARSSSAADSKEELNKESNESVSTNSSLK